MDCLGRLLYAWIIALAAIQPVCAQTAQPVSWYFEGIRLNDAGYKLLFTAVMDEGWHVYSQNTGEIMQTKVEFELSGEFELAGNLEESPNSIERFDPVFRMPVKWFERSAWFSQAIKLTAPATVVKGKVIFTCSNNIEYLPVKVINFSIAVKADNIINDTVMAHVTTAAVTDLKELLAQDQINEMSATSEPNYPIAPVWLVAFGAVLGGLTVWLAQRLMARFNQTASLSASGISTKKDSAH